MPSSDHQVAHVYVREPSRIAAVKALLERLPGVERVLDRREQAAIGLDHERSGELVAIAAADRWFTYYYWLDDARAPDYARTVDIHRKPGYDPAELFVDPALTAAAAENCGDAREEDARLPIPDERDSARRIAGARARTAVSPTRLDDGPVLHLVRDGTCCAMTSSNQPTCAT